MIHKDKIKKILELSKKDFLNEDSLLLDININERSLTHKFAEYIQKNIHLITGKYNVDCEYNRDGSDIKLVEGLKSIVVSSVKTDSLEAKSYYPDIIVHKRGQEGPNILIIEAKKDPTYKLEQKDIKKLKILKSHFNYQYAIFLIFDTKEKQINWKFINSDA